MTNRDYFTAGLRDTRRRFARGLAFYVLLVLAATVATIFLRAAGISEDDTAEYVGMAFFAVLVFPWARKFYAWSAPRARSAFSRAWPWVKWIAIIFLSLWVFIRLINWAWNTPLWGGQ